MNRKSSHSQPGMFRALGVVVIAAMLWTSSEIALGDPCGMVPPLRLGDGTTPLIERIDVQRTYVCFDRGIESIVIRPAFLGRVAEFGMLIPFPQPPEVRKVDDRIFQHIAAAINPPEVTISLTPPRRLGGLGGGGLGGAGFFPHGPPSRGFGGLGVIRKDQVAVLKEDAVGMYEVAVLAAGSAESLNKWMTDNGYRYPEGMDEVCNEYIEQLWGFVAVKTRVAAKSNVDPQPGQRSVRAQLPVGAGFEGHVQAMGFRFRSDEFVVPMRLSAFNTGPLRNVVYVLAEGPKAIRHIPEEFVIRQVAGKQLLKNCTELLPLRVLGGEIRDGRIVNGTLVAGRIENLTKEQLRKVEPTRDPTPHNGLAKDLFISDMLSIGRGTLVHPHEARHMQLAAVSASLGLAGAEIDKLYDIEISAGDELRAYEQAEDWVGRMTLSVIDGDFPRDVLAKENLTFRNYRMRSPRRERHYGSGVRITSADIGFGRASKLRLDLIAVAFAAVVALGLVIHRFQNRRRVS